MRKKLLKPVAIGALLLAITATPVFFAQSRSANLKQEENAINTELSLLEGTFIDGGVFFDTVSGFSFRIPPVWEDNFIIFQFHNYTTFMLNPETTNSDDFLVTIGVFDISQNADYYHAIPENFEEDFIILQETENLIYAYKIFERNADSNADSNLFETMKAPLNGVEDLFNLILNG